jgi:hypothetical protein
MIGCDGFRDYPIRGLDTAISTIPRHWLAHIQHMARRNAVIMRGFAAHWHSRGLDISYHNVAWYCASMEE